ncbi:MAG TPA: tetratricopeptide repeat protein [Candidatus Dormibacteraeota bacterium]|nr:tetratricopeptide repeat protein [Candidatus Dormibacteraeota bacterium]
MPNFKNPRFWICAGLLLIVGAFYWPVVSHGFVVCDDPDYVYENPIMRGGLSWTKIGWAFTTGYANNWHPITWISHMLDCQFFGMRPGMQHVVNATYHAINTVLLFILLSRLTQAIWRSAFVAALFALHPMHVESVAWIAERKDVLSTFFFLLTLLAYARYVERSGRARRAIENPTPKLQTSGKLQNPSSISAQNDSDHCSVFGVQCSRSRIWYCAALLLFALGLMSKPMLVTLPFVLLLLDFWPLDRLRIAERGLRKAELETSTSKFQTPGKLRKPSFESQTFFSLVVEKIPFFALTFASCVVTVIVQRQHGNMASVEVLPVGIRFTHSLVSYQWYFLKAFWPTRLAAYYPFGPESDTLIFGAVSLLATVSIMVLLFWRRLPFLAFGWFWFLGTLVPAIGLVQVGSAAMANRYTYIPYIGLFLAATWGVCAIIRVARTESSDASTEPAARPLWRNPWSYLLPFIGVAVLVLCTVGASAQLRTWKDSETLYRHALLVTKNNVHAELNLGTTLLAKGDAKEAADHFAAALRMFPDYPEAKANLGITLAMQGKYEEAISVCRSALQAKPDSPKLHYLLGNALNAAGKHAEAVAEFKAELELNPNHVLALNDLAWALATNPDPDLRNGPEAVILAERACKLSDFEIGQFVGTLAAAYAQAGRFEDAIKTGEKAKALAAKAGETDLVKRNQELLQLYGAHKPFHEQPSTTNEHQ